MPAKRPALAALTRPLGPTTSRFLGLPFSNGQETRRLFSGTIAKAVNRTGEPARQERSLSQEGKTVPEEGEPPPGTERQRFPSASTHPNSAIAWSGCTPAEPNLLFAKRLREYYSTQCYSTPAAAAGQSNPTSAPCSMISRVFQGLWHFLVTARLPQKVGSRFSAVSSFRRGC